MTVQNKNIIRIALGAVLLLLIPLLLMQFTDELDWRIGDFIVMGILLFSAGLAYQLLAKKMSTTAHRVAVAIAIGIVFLLIWAELAVDIFGTSFAGS
jgi:Kef-type K+ transport system membrane component KefB